MITEIYIATTKSVDELQQLVTDGNTLLLREKFNMPEVTVPCRFRLMTDEEGHVFKQLFPVETKLSNYTDPVPLDVLQALDEAQTTCPYKHKAPLVWHAKAYDPDPVLLLPVRTVNDGHDWCNGYLLVARWGDALVPFDQLATKALNLWRNERVRKLRDIINEAKHSLEVTLESNTIFGSTPYVSL